MTRQQDLCGTRARYNFEDCRCGPCTEAQRVYHADRRRKVAYRQWNPFVDAEPARLHVQALRRAGMGRRRIGELANVEQGMLWRLEHGNAKKGRPPTRQLRKATADRILAVSASLDDLAGTALVDATGSHRRLQALVAVGWPQARIAQRLGVTAANMGSLMRRPRVLASRARAIRDLYEELWDSVPDCNSTQQRLAVTRARAFAVSRGWAVPMAWDNIDDPDEQPNQPTTVQGIDSMPFEDIVGGLVAWAAAEAAPPVATSIEVDGQLIDLVAVRHTLEGTGGGLTIAERRFAVDIATRAGMSAADIAKRIGSSQRNVVRDRNTLRGAAP